MRFSVSAMLLLATYAAIAVAAIATRSFLLLVLLVVANGLTASYFGILAAASRGGTRFKALGFVVVFLAYVLHCYFVEDGRRISKLAATAAGYGATPNVTSVPMLTSGPTSNNATWVLTPTPNATVVMTASAFIADETLAIVDVALAMLAGLCGVGAGALAYRNAVKSTPPPVDSHSD